jgi:hypothetical protein
MRVELKKRIFKNDEEEANWWDEHQDALANEFEKAVVSGTLRSSPSLPCNQEGTDPAPDRTK